MYRKEKIKKPKKNRKNFRDKFSGSAICGANFAKLD